MSKNNDYEMAFLTWHKLRPHLEQYVRVAFHFTDYECMTYPDMIPDENKDARIVKIYVGIDNLLHIRFFDKYKGEKYNAKDQN